MNYPPSTYWELGKRSSTNIVITHDLISVSFCSVLPLLGNQLFVGRRPCLICSPSSVKWYVSMPGSFCDPIQESYAVLASCGGIWILCSRHRTAHMHARMIISQIGLIPSGISMDNGSSGAEVTVCCSIFRFSFPLVPCIPWHILHSPASTWRNSRTSDVAERTNLGTRLTPATVRSAYIHIHIVGTGFSSSEFTFQNSKLRKGKTSLN